MARSTKSVRVQKPVGPQPAPPVEPRKRTRRHDAAAARRAAIAQAALDAFSEHGFAATRMDDVAARAGVAKGTIYLHFADKRALFEGILAAILAPALDGLGAHRPRPDERLRDFMDRAIVPLFASLGRSRAGDVIRLLIAEGDRFPELAAIYHRDVISRGLALLQALSAHGRATGELHDDTLERFPQLLVAPALVGLIWGRLFERLQPLDTEALLRRQLDLILGPR